MIKKPFLFSVFLFLQIGLIAQTANILDKKIKQISEESNLSGFSVSIANADKVLFSKGYGFADKEAKIPYQTHHSQVVASVSKTWIGIALMKCIEQGKFSLDTDINKILPFKVINPNFPNQPITIKHLATHTSSITYSIPDNHKIVFEEEPNLKMFSFLEKRIVKKILKNPKVKMGDYLKDYLSPQGKNYDLKHFSSNEAGQKYEYSNMASTLAAHLVEVASGQSFDEFCKENIIEPLGLKNTSFNVFSHDKSKMTKLYFGKKQKQIPLYSHNFYPTGGLRISNDELNLFLMEIIKGYQGKGKLLSKENYQTLLKQQFQEGQLPIGFPSNETNHGIFWTYRGDLIGHTGGGLGVSTFLFFDKNTGIGKIFITNCELESNKKLVPQFLKVWKLLGEYESQL